MSEKTPIQQPLPWQQNQWQSVLQQFESQRLPHGVLVQGVSGLGKKQFVFAIIQKILCLDTSKNIACGECKSCQLFATENHPDFFSVEPESEGKAIKIDQVRELVTFLSKTAQQGGFKCVMISPADAMNENSKNALLKSLEEPQGDTIIFLVSSNPSRLSATIRSRCQSIVMHVPSRDVAMEWLQSKIPSVNNTSESLSKDVDILSTLLNISQGAPLAALDAFNDDLLAQQEQFQTMLEQVLSGETTIVAGAKIAVDIGATKSVDFLLNFLAQSITDRLINQEANVSDTEEATIQDKVRQRAGMSPNLVKSPSLNRQQFTQVWAAYDLNDHGFAQQLFRYRDKVIDYKGLILSTANPNPNLLWEELLMDWVAVNRRQSTTRPARRASR